MKKIIRNIVLIVVILCIIWSAMVIVDFIRSKDLREPLFATSISLNQHGEGRYRGIGYDVISKARAFNGKDYVLYDMEFMLFGRGNGGKKTIYDNYRHNLGLLGVDEKTVINSLKALKFITPDVKGNQKIYTEYVNGNDVKVMNLIFYNDIVTGFEYEYHNLEAAFDFAKYLRKDLELTFGTKTTYPEIEQSNKDYFDNVKDVSDLKSQYTYYEDWKASFDYNRKDNIEIMLGGKDYSGIDIRFELSVIDENKATVSVKYVVIP